MVSSSYFLIVLFSLLELLLTMLVIALIVKKRPSVFHDNNGLSKTEEKFPDPLKNNCSKYMLTSREVEILKLLREGLPYKLIASQLNISIRTVTTHVANMFAKVNVTNKMELVNKITET